ncbi:glycosyltransferase [Riemerella anatipestifer]|uniref:glycosyltransferase n=1 Tax=Riemerella anatipestifer TaxID=34085 RepID=UPI0012B315A7|nr:glycosyltransferase [Riemerella anatipestifer]MSN86614.1 glycosyltransferase [Riemerella anatipestifer]
MFKGSLHEQLVKGLVALGLDVTYLDIENPPKFKNNYLPDKFRNIFERIVRKNKQYYLIAEKNHYNRFFYNKLFDLKKKGKKYDYVLIIKPEEYSSKLIKLASEMGDITVGYIWDGLRLFFKKSLVKSVKHLDNIYSFDVKDIKNHPDLNMSFCTNYYIPDNTDLVPYDSRKIDVFYVGALAGTLPEQRRDVKIDNVAKYLDGNVELNIFVSQSFLEGDNNLVKNPKVQYITSPTSIEETLQKTQNSKIVIDICKKHHIGLSFRFFECMLYETKMITNNIDVVNYDFYHPDNILVVDFDNIDIYAEDIKAFQNKPYHKLSKQITQKYALDNWIKYLFKEQPYEEIKHL